MGRSRLVVLLCGLLGALIALGGLGGFAVVGGGSARGGLSRGQIRAAYGRLPLSFAQNRGQASAGVDYVAGGAGWGLGLGPGGVRFALAYGRGSQSVLRVTTPGGRLRSPVASQRLPGRVSYFSGRDRARWVSGAPAFARVVYRDVWPGVDLAFHGRQGALEYDLDLAPGADPGRVALRFAGARAVTPDGHGGAVIALPGGTVRVRAPRAAQGARAVPSRLVVGGDTIRLALGGYDHTRALVVDPDLVYSTYLDGRGGASAIAVDSVGDAYVTGIALPGLATTSGAYQTSLQGGMAVYVTKLNATGSALVYSTYLGGNVSEPSGIAVDSSGDAYVTGFAGGAFPTTSGAYQTALSGFSDPFVTKLNPSGSGLVYSTYLGGNGATPNGIAVDSGGDAYVTGNTNAYASFPTTPGAYQTVFGGAPGAYDAFVTKLNPTGSGLVYSTYLGNGDYANGIAVDANGIAVDSAGDAYVTGSAGAGFPTTAGAYQTTYGGGCSPLGAKCPTGSAFVTKLNPAGSALVYSTYLGGSSFGQAIAVDSSGDAYLTGGGSVPTTPGAAYQKPCGYNAFVSKLNPSGGTLLYSTCLADRVNSYTSFGKAIAVDSSGDAYVTGGSPDIGNAMTKLNPAGSALLYSTSLGVGSPGGIAVDSAGDTYVTGDARPGLPTTPGAYRTTGGGPFVVKLSLAAEVLWGLRASPSTFTLGGRRVDGQCVKKTRANRHHQSCTRPIKLKVSYQLSTPARMTIKIARLLRGHVSHGRCVKPTHSNRKHRYCNRLASVPGTRTIRGGQGTNSFTFNGRPGGHKLTPGRYQLTATSTVNGQTGTPTTVTFTIAS